MKTPIRWLPLFAEGAVISASVLLVACSESNPAAAPPEWPFDPSGVWEGDAAGALRGNPLTSALALSLSDDRSSCDYCLSGTWEWGGLAGEAGAFWAFDGPADCDPDPGVYCPFSVTLEPPAPGACSEPPAIVGGGQALIHLRAEFDGEARLIAPELKGAFWEGAPSDGWPCPGPELLFFDTQTVLAQR